MYTMLTTIGDHTHTVSLSLDEIEKVMQAIWDAGFHRTVVSVFAYDFTIGTDVRISFFCLGDHGDPIELPRMRCHTCNKTASKGNSLSRALHRNYRYSLETVYLCRECLDMDKPKYVVTKHDALVSGGAA